MAREFSGGVTTDKLTTSFTTHNSTRTYALWTYAQGDGGGNLPRYFDKRTSSQVELLFLNENETAIDFARTWSGTDGLWRAEASPTENAWHHIAVIYDSGSTSNVPLIYIDGASQGALTVLSGPPTGTVTDNSEAYVIGNRGNDDARSWDGYLWQFGIWDRILTAAEIGILADGFTPAHLPRSLVFHAPLEDNIIDHQGTGAITDTGTSAIAAPRTFNVF